MIAAVAAILVLLALPGTAHPAFPGANGRIVFASDRDGAQDVYTMSPDGSNQTRLTDAAGDDQYPMWSADGTKIVFSSFREGNEKLFTMNADGSLQTRLSDTPSSNDEEPSFSRTGSKIVFRSDRELGLQIWTMNADGSNPTRITGTSDTELNLDPVWSPNVDRIAFASNRDGDFDIYTMDAFGNNVVPITSNAAADFNPDWSPDGTKLVFQSDVSGNFDVWLYANGALTQLTNDPAFDSAPTWSPDGTKIAFQSNRDGDFEIYTMNADGTGITKLTDNDSTDRVADWQPLVSGGSDTTPPTLSLPGTITVDATSPAGAVVSFSVSATDAVDPSPTVSCDHASATSYPVGVTSVSCTARDRAGNTSSGSFAIVVVSGRDQLQRLSDEVAASLIPSIQKTLLSSLLRAASNRFDATPPQKGIGCAALGSFRILTSVWSGHGISPSLATKWIAEARRIEAALGC